VGGGAARDAAVISQGQARAGAEEADERPQAEGQEAIAMRVLFVCTANKLRSPTAEDVFKGRQGFDVISAGTAANAPVPLTAELVASADLIFAMETHHRDRIRKKFKKRPADDRIVTLHIPDDYERGDASLVALLKEKVEPRLAKSTTNI